jgi:hypothetical protein
MECCKYIYDLSAKEYENLRHVIDTIFFAVMIDNILISKYHNLLNYERHTMFYPIRSFLLING